MFDNHNNVLDGPMMYSVNNNTWVICFLYAFYQVIRTSRNKLELHKCVQTRIGPYYAMFVTHKVARQPAYEKRTTEVNIIKVHQCLTKTCTTARNRTWVSQAKKGSTLNVVSRPKEFLICVHPNSLVHLLGDNLTLDVLSSINSSPHIEVR